MNKKIFLIPLITLSLIGVAGCDIPSSSSEPSSSTQGPSSSSSGIVAKYNVYFSAGEDIKISTQKVVSGGKAKKPEDPVKNLVQFLGWYTNPDCLGEPYDFDLPVTNNLVLYAKWSSLDSAAISAYNKEWEEKSQKDHLYIHYLRYNNTPEEYEAWDIWSWPWNADGTNFDFVKGDDGKIITDEFGGAYVDIDLTKTYSPAGWLSGAYVPGLTMSYVRDEGFVSKVGFQIVLKETRNQVGSFWTNDGDDNSVLLEEAKWDNGSYHVFAVENNVPNFTTRYTSEQAENPYENDDGNNVSIANIKSSEASKYGRSLSSNAFKNNVGVGYQIMVASFADSDGDGWGDIYGITKKLDYLKNTLHVNTIWLTPIQLSDSYHAYDIIDYKVVDAKFGSKESPNTQNGKPTNESAMKDYEDLLKKAEEKGIKVVMDLVVNHTSKKHVWFMESSQLNPDYRSYYQWKKVTDSAVKNNKNWHQYSSTNYAYYGKFASSMPELNYDYQGTRDAMVDVAHFWMDKGVDGFRIDAVKHIYMADEVTKSSGDDIREDFDTATSTDYSSNLTKNINFFQEFNARIKQKNPDAFLVGENFDGAALTNVSPYYQGMDSLFDFYMYYKMSNVAMGDSGKSNNMGARANSVANTGGEGWNFPGVYAKYNSYSKNNSAIESVFTSNHDVARSINMMIGTAPNADDQKMGTLTSSNASLAIKRAKCYSAVMTLLPGVTWIYYGDELGMSSNFASGETSTSPHVDRWYRQPYKFGNEVSGTPDADGVYQTGFNFTGGAGFSIGYDSYNKNTLKSASDQIKDSNSLLSHYSKLTEIKSSKAAFISGSYTGIQQSETVFAFKRSGGNETYYVFVNFGNSSVNISNKPNGTNVYSFGSVSGATLGAHSGVIIKA